MKNRNTHTLNVIVNEFARHGVNILQLLQSLDAIVNSSEDFITIVIREQDGTETTRKLPSIGRIKNDIASLQTMLDDLYDIKNNEVFVISNGVKHPVYIPEYPYDLLPPLNLSRTRFVFKNNRYYARLFLNNIEKTIRYKKYIIKVENQEFEDITVENERQLITFLDGNNIKYKIVEDIQRNLPGTIRFVGSFFVTSSIKNKYRLSTLNYTNLENESFRLNVGDVLYFDNTEVRIEQINFNTNEIEVKTIKGYNSITVGKELKLLSPFDYKEFIEIPTAVEEKFIVFIKNVNETFNVESLQQSEPFKVNVIDLTSDVEEEEIEENIGNFNVEVVKEQLVPAALGTKPNSTILRADDFNVVRINNHLFQEQVVTAVQEKVSRKNELVSEINEIDKGLDEKKSILASTQDISRERVRSVQNDLDSLVNKRKLKTGEYTSILNELSAVNKDKVKFIKPKFRIRGFFDIPQEIFSEVTGTQRIVQFLISYRYKGLNQEVSDNKNFVRTDEAGNKKFGVFSDWVEVDSPKRVKVIDEETGEYVWEEQQTEDGQKVNINQIDIPIQKGEIVEFRIKSISEAGFPAEPLMSSWSNIVAIPFPDEITEVNDVSDIIENTIADDANLVVDNVLAARGVEFHIRNSITRNEQYFAHPASEISSGIYDAAGNLLTLETVVKQYENQISELRRIVEREIPELKLSLISPTGDEVILNTNTKNRVFAGYYVDDISSIPENEQNGAIINKEYQLLLYNTSGTSLFFRSGAPGGIGTDVDNSTYELDTFRKYETAPILYNDTFGIQKKGQFLYGRGTNYKLATDLYFNDPNADEWYIGYTPLPLNAETFMQSNLSQITGGTPIFGTDETGAFAYINLSDDIEDLYVGAADYGAVKELKSGKENGIRIPINFRYKLTEDTTGNPPTANVEFRKVIGLDIFLFQLNTVSLDIEFITRYTRDTF